MSPFAQLDASDACAGEISALLSRETFTGGSYRRAGPPASPAPQFIWTHETLFLTDEYDSSVLVQEIDDARRQVRAFVWRTSVMA
jgi:hypothetical protein